MIVCPVCEHPQAAGEACDNCGKQLVVAKLVAAPVTVLPELEETHHRGGQANVVSERLAELDQTQHLKGADLPAQALPELERTRAADAGAVAVERMGEMDAGRFLDTEAKVAAPSGAVTCRYCRNVQADGMMCEKCGMRLPRAAAPVAKKTGPAADGLVDCGSCGVRSLPGRRCASCGVAVPALE